MAEVRICVGYHAVEYYHRTVDETKGKRFECKCGWRSPLSNSDAEIRPLAKEHMNSGEPYFAFALNERRDVQPDPSSWKRGDGSPLFQHCEACGNPVESSLAEISHRKFERVYCPACFAKAERLQGSP